jgi:hypothetical protein
MSVHRSFELGTQPRVKLNVPPEVEGARLTDLWVGGIKDGKPNFLFEPKDVIGDGTGTGFSGVLPGFSHVFQQSETKLDDAIRAAQDIAKWAPNSSNGTVAVYQAKDGSHWLSGTFVKGMDIPVDRIPKYPRDWELDRVTIGASPEVKAFVGRENVIRLKDGRGEITWS